MKGNDRNKRRQVSHDRQGRPQRQDGKKKGNNNGNHFNDYSGI